MNVGGHSVLAHRSKYTYYEKCILNIFQYYKNSEKQPRCISEYSMFVLKVLREEDISYGLCKNDK
jgi:hypothetical protein